MTSKRGPHATEPIEQRLGPELRRLREASGISLRTLAERAGFSPSFISQLENAQVSPSIASLERIAAALNVTLADLFATEETSEVFLVRADERPSFRSSWSRARVDSLMPAGKHQPFEAIMVTIEPGGASGKHAAGVASDQLAVVFSGQLTLTLAEDTLGLQPALTLAEDTLGLQPGDAVLIRARSPHRWQNREDTAAQVLLVSSRSVR